MLNLPFVTNTERDNVSEDVIATLESLGCDTSDKHGLNMGVMAYNIGVLIALKRAGILELSSPKSTKAGRNDPCPCGSGRKYKKCCLDKNASANHISSDSPAALDPEAIPRMWDDSRIYAYTSMLSKLIESKAFAECHFSGERVAEHMQDAMSETPVLQNETDWGGEAVGEIIDQIAFRYAKKSGEWKKLKKMKDILLEEASHAKTSEETQALACGVAFALVGESSGKDGTENPLTAMLFRNAFFRFMQKQERIQNIFERMKEGWSSDEPENLDDDSRQVFAQKFQESVSEEEIGLISEAFEQSLDDLWDVLAEGKFPVSLPFATQTTLLERLGKKVSEDKKTKPQEVEEILLNFSEELLEDDYVMFEKILETWKNNHEDAPARVMKAVLTMEALCKSRDISEFLPILFRESGSNDIRSSVEDSERRLIDAYMDEVFSDDDVKEYEAWLRERGYHAAADRLLAEWIVEEDEDKSATAQN